MDDLDSIELGPILFVFKFYFNPVEVTLAKKRPDMAVVPCANNRPGENEYFQQRFKQV